MKSIGRYEICGLLGKGGMARVYRVRLPVIDKVAALKCLDPDPTLAALWGADRLRALFVAEARTLAAIRHPQVIDIWGYEEIDGRPCYLMAYYCNSLGTLVGESLRTNAPCRTLPTEQALHYTRQILQGLDCLHREGIVHRDVKPANVLITDQDTVKLCDFGLSRRRGEKTLAPPNLKVGSPWYAAPEQERDPDAATPRADLYSVGVVLHRMLTGRLPAEAASPPSRLNADIDDRWDRLIARSTARDPAQRFADAGRMLAAVEAVAEHWRAERDRLCRMGAGPAERAPSPSAAPAALRSRALTARRRQAAACFGLDRLWRPRRPRSGDFVPAGNGLVADRAAGLTWQAAGSAYPLTWQRACRYVEDLNRAPAAEGSDWRLPTVDELISLLARVPHGRDHCLAPLFDPSIHRLWSIDRKSFCAAWYVNTRLGFVDWQDDSCLNYVRAVRSVAA